MKELQQICLGVRQMRMPTFLLAGMILISCSSAPDPQSEPSKDEVQKDADRFFDKMKQEEKKLSYPE